MELERRGGDGFIYGSLASNLLASAGRRPGCFVQGEIRVEGKSLGVEITLDTNCNLPRNHRPSREEFSLDFSVTFNKDSNGRG